MAYMNYGYPAYQPQPQPQPQINMGYMTPSMQSQMAIQQNPNGKIVDSIEMVKFTDIPMDGNSYYFPKADGSEIYSKRWLPNGSTEINTYAKVVEKEQQEEEPKFDFNLMETNIMDKLNSLEERFAKFEKGFGVKTASNKKEV